MSQYVSKNGKGFKMESVIHDIYIEWCHKKTISQSWGGVERASHFLALYTHTFMQLLKSEGNCIVTKLIITPWIHRRSILASCPYWWVALTCSLESGKMVNQAINSFFSLFVLKYSLVYDVFSQERKWMTAAKKTEHYKGISIGESFLMYMLKHRWFCTGAHHLFISLTTVNSWSIKFLLCYKVRLCRNYIWTDCSAI
jgi:hypothetical protein